MKKIPRVFPRKTSTSKAPTPPSETAEFASENAAHFDNRAVEKFAYAMRIKLAVKRLDGRGGWQDKEQCSNEYLSRLLREHVEKGDPIDVANFAMMLHQRGERIADLEAMLPPTPQPNVMLPRSPTETMENAGAGEFARIHDGGLEDHVICAAIYTAMTDEFFRALASEGSEG